MAKTSTKAVKIKLDKERVLRYPIFSLIRLEKETGIKIQDLADEKKAQDLSVILGLVWAGLIHEDKELTMEDVGNMIELSQLPDVSAKMTEAFAVDEPAPLAK